MSYILYYDDGYEHLQDNVFKIDDNQAVRVYKLSNGDIFKVNELLLEFEDNLLYEVTEKRNSVYATYIRTSRVFTPNEINNMVIYNADFIGVDKCNKYM